MNKSSDLSWLARWVDDSADVGDDTDSADMGTAFGLDSSMLPPDACGPDSALPCEPLSAWERRLVRRSGL